MPPELETWNLELVTMAPPRKKAQSLSQLKALQKVRKALPPPSRVQDGERKYQRAAQRRATREEVEREAPEE